MATLVKRENAHRREFRKVSAYELGKPKARLGNPNTGIPEVIVQPLYDIYAVAPSNAMGKLILFTLQLGSTYNFNGVTAFQKGQGHTNLVQAGMLESSYTFVVRALSIYCQALQGQVANGSTIAGPLLNAEDLINFLSSFMQFTINRKSYYDGIGAWLPGGGGAFASGVGTLTAPSASSVVSNGLPQSRNTYAIPGGQFINPQETFAFLIDPTQNAGGTPGALAYAGDPAGVLGAGLMAWVRLDGTLNRVAQ